MNTFHCKSIRRNLISLEEKTVIYIIIYQAKIIYSLNLFNVPLSTDSNGSSTIQSRCLINDCQLQN